MVSTKKTGDKGEKAAAEYLMKKGFKLLGRNYRSRFGEIDLVMKDKNTVVFVEVKAKRGDKFGAPWEMVGNWKMEQVKRMGTVWIQEYEWEGGVRMDVVGVRMDYQGEVEEIKHYKSV